MPLVSVDNSSFSKFKKIRLEKRGLNMYISLEEDNEDVSKTKGQCESRGPDVIVVRVVAKVGRETWWDNAKEMVKAQI